ncbi:MAG: MarR family transcriptional regulator [Pseudomonadota bacterium]
MSTDKNTVAIMLISELLAADHVIRSRLARVLPKGMEISHFSVLNHLSWQKGETSPARLAEKFGVTRGAMTNTVNKLEWAGYIHVRPDWDDARRKMVTISPAGRLARDTAVAALTPMIDQVVEDLGEDQARAALPILREIRTKLT